MAVSLQKLIKDAEGDWEYVLKSWNSDADNISNHDLIDEAQAKKWAGMSPKIKSTTYGSEGSPNYKTPTTAVGWIGAFMETQKRGVAGDRGEMVDFEKGLDTFFNQKGRLRGPGDIMGNLLSKAGEEALLHLQQQSDLLTIINEKTGLTGELSRAFRREIMDAEPFALSLGVSFEKMSEMVADTVAQSGKFKLLSTETIQEMTLASKFIDDIGQLGTLTRNFELIGLGVGDMSRSIQQAAKSSLEMGINARTVTKLVSENLDKVNQYGFKNGVEGLTRMAQKSVEFRMNMSAAFAFAEKVWDPDKALDLVANLQVLGGAFGDLNDPLKLMYMATNDVEGLQVAITDAAKSLVTYNNEQGRFEITGVNLRRAKAMAEAMGIEYKDLANTAVASMERVQASTDLMSRGFDIKKEDKDFLTNLARMEGGKMVISIPENLQKQFQGTTIALDSMTEKQARMLLDQKEAFKELSVEDYARQQVNALENIRRDLSFIRAAVRIGIGREIGEQIENNLGYTQERLIGDVKNLRNVIMEKGVNRLIPESTHMNRAMVNDMMKTQLAEIEAQKGYKGKKMVNAENISEEKTTSKEESKPSVTRHEHVFTVRSYDNATDEIKRMLWSDQKFIGDFKRSYLESLPQEK